MFYCVDIVEDASIAGCVKMLKLKFKFMLGWKGIDRGKYEISVFYSFRLF